MAAPKKKHAAQKFGEMVDKLTESVNNLIKNVPCPPETKARCPEFESCRACWIESIRIEKGGE